MIPKLLSIKNFLSYHEASLDFSGLQTACICGANGAGKSSLLEAITWAVWGKSRATEDNILHTGAKEARVDFTFESNGQTYRVIRSRQRGGSSALEFQVQAENNFRSLTAKGVRATQELIIHHLKLDYDTFINSAYLRQGKADEFMLKSPAERKQILADLLKLDQYEALAEQAKDIAKQHKAQAEQLEQSLQGIKLQLQQRETVTQQAQNLEAELTHLQQLSAADSEQLHQLNSLQIQRQGWEQQLSFAHQEYEYSRQEIERLKKENFITQKQIEEINLLLAQEAEINAGYQHYQALQEQVDLWLQKSRLHQDTLQQRQQLEQQLNKALNSLQLELSQAELQLENLQRDRQEIEETLQARTEVEAGVQQLKNARNLVASLDELKLQFDPLSQRQQQLIYQIERSRDRITTHLEELDSNAYQLETQLEQQPQQEAELAEVDFQLEEITKKDVYKQRVHDKGLERRSFMDRLQENQRECERKQAEIAQKLQLLEDPNAACPLCDRALDESHKLQILAQYSAQQQDLQNQVWVVREQLAVCEQELKVLRQEYGQIVQDMAIGDSLKERRGQLKAKLAANQEIHRQLKRISQESKELSKSLQTGDYAKDLQTELSALNLKLEQLQYDEKNHALARNEVDRWRWSEIKYNDIKQALKKQDSLDNKQPEIVDKVAKLRLKIQELQTSSELVQQIAKFDQTIAELGYNRSYHDGLQKQLRQAEFWQKRYQELSLAQARQPQQIQRLTELSEALERRSQTAQNFVAQIQQITQQLADFPDVKPQIQQLEQRLQQHRQQQDDRQRQLGRLQQQIAYLEDLQQQLEQQQQQLTQASRQQRIYLELAQAFGKNGIQTLMIENILPQLEAQTNQLLSRLSGNQLHVQFVTQKAGKRTTKKTSKLIDTLEILIADAQGTRPYETYSGGEAFRINFAIRLALARLLAQRAGTALQMLIVDEGFGTQDSEGCDRLIAAINAISSDFACILTVTHMPQFKEAFSARIEVRKSAKGSQLAITC